MTVEELIRELHKYDKNMVVVDYTLDEIESVYSSTLTHNNYSYDQPDVPVVVLR